MEKLFIHKLIKPVVTKMTFYSAIAVLCTKPCYTDIGTKIKQTLNLQNALLTDYFEYLAKKG